MRRAAEGEPDGAAADAGVYLEARSVFTRESHPYRRATLCNNLGNSYLKWPAAVRDADVLAAREEYGRSLEVFTRDHYPAEWARGHGNLGAAALEFRSVACRRAEAPQAIQAIQRALEVYTQDAYPDEWARVTKNLGTAHLEDGNPDAAVLCWQRAHDHWAGVIEWTVGPDAPARQMTELARRIAHARILQGGTTRPSPHWRRPRRSASAWRSPAPAGCRPTFRTTNGSNTGASGYAHGI